MNKIIINQTDFESILENLQVAVDTCGRVDYHEDAEVENTPPYIVGWTYQTLKCTIQTLQLLQELSETSNNV